MELYPRFRYLVRKGDENLVLTAAQAGVKGMAEHYVRLSEEPDDLVKEDWPEMLEGLKTPGTFTACRKHKRGSAKKISLCVKQTWHSIPLPFQISAVLENYPARGLDLKKLFKANGADHGYFGHLYSKRSPWVKPLNEGECKLSNSYTTDMEDPTSTL